MPTQILAAAARRPLVIDAVGSALMAAGRARALLGYGVAHFVVYVGAVFMVSSRGVAAVAIAAAVVHTIFLVIAYEVLLRGHEHSALRFLWGDIAAALISCAVLVAIAGPTACGRCADAGAPVLVQLVVVGAAAAASYLAALRMLFRGASDRSGGGDAPHRPRPPAPRVGRPPANARGRCSLRSSLRQSARLSWRLPPRCRRWHPAVWPEPQGRGGAAEAREAAGVAEGQTSPAWAMIVPARLVPAPQVVSFEVNQLAGALARSASQAPARAGRASGA